MVRPTRWSRTADCLATSSPGIGRRPADTDRQMIVGRPGPALHGSPAWAVHARPTPPALRREVRPGVPPPGPGECQAMAFDDELRLLGFQRTQERRGGPKTFSLARNRFLTYWLHVPADDGGGLFTWEFAIGE